MAGALGLGAVVVGAAFGHRLLSILYRPEYADRDLLVRETYDRRRHLLNGKRAVLAMF